VVVCRLDQSRARAGFAAQRTTRHASPFSAPSTGGSGATGRARSRAVPERRWDPKFPRRDTTVLWSAAARSRWRATCASARGCRSPRSPSVWVARRRRSRRTSTIRLRLTKDPAAHDRPPDSQASLVRLGSRAAPVSTLRSLPLRERSSHHRSHAKGNLAHRGPSGWGWSSGW